MLLKKNSLGHETSFATSPSQAKSLLATEVTGAWRARLHNQYMELQTTCLSACFYFAPSISTCQTSQLFMLVVPHAALDGLHLFSLKNVRMVLPLSSRFKNVVAAETLFTIRIDNLFRPIKEDSRISLEYIW
eukprot:gnl/TRDRNA2_/TRDRNA2_161010_c1_seq1.p1 gnl/TRDRNA2_/TRDRNA2_161010_c1~~gnl/TRDRNA2_/TRDRNA2_161010_c1_seq1.p1  ORF type:complete len:132 (+),score=10.39 gnl/TRDRNA2_/TRDRNA2_161010_c1_seq1:465-860(+)